MIHRIQQKFLDPDIELFAGDRNERVPGRMFNIVPEDCQAATQMGALLAGMEQSAEKFGAVVAAAENLKKRLPEEYQTFFNDNLVVQAKFMTHVSRSLHHFVAAYKNQTNRELAAKLV